MEDIALAIWDYIVHGKKLLIGIGIGIVVLVVGLNMGKSFVKGRNLCAEAKEAILRDDSKQLIEIINQGCSMECTPDGNGETLVMVAIKNNRANSAVVLLGQGADREAKTKQGKRAADFVGKDTDSRIVEALKAPSL